MNAARDQHPRTIVGHVLAAKRELTIVVWRIVEATVLDDVEMRGETLDARDDFILVAPKLSLTRKPLRAFGGTPGDARGADRVGSQRDVLRTKSATVS